MIIDIDMENINRLDLNLLTVFDAVMRRRSVSRAAADLGLTQSTVSNALRRLREALGDPLFLRESHGVTPTAFADELAPHVETALAALQDGLDRSRRFDPVTAERRFNVIMTDIAEAVILPRLLDLCRATAPGVSLRAMNLAIDETAAALRSGEADLAIGFLPDFAGRFYQRFLFDTPYVCIAAADNPIARGPLTLKKFAAARHAVAEAQGTGHSVVQQVLEKRGIRLRVGALVPHFLSIPYVVAASDLIATVPRGFGVAMHAPSALKMMPHPVELPNVDIRLLWHERFQRDPANRWLRERLVEVFETVEWT